MKTCIHYLLRIVLVIAPFHDSYAYPVQVPYSGQLAESGELVNGTRTMKFKLLAAETGGTLHYDTGALSVVLTNGGFSVVLGGPGLPTLDSAVFNGDARWLEISVAPSNSLDFMVLSPRQPVRHTPYSAYAFGAGTATDAAALGGMNPTAFAQVAASNSWSQPQHFAAGLWTPMIRAETNFSINIPRIGQEVIVDFLGGDPDRPVIVGQAYNHSDAPPFHGTSIGLRAEDAAGADRDGGHVILSPGSGSGSGRPGQIIFNGEVTSLEPEFSLDSAPVVIHGYDKSHRLNLGRHTRAYSQDSLIIETLRSTTPTNGFSLLLKASDAPGTNHNGGNLVLMPGNGTGDGFPGFVIIGQATNEMPYRPARITPKTIVRGPQTALVVGPSEDQDLEGRPHMTLQGFGWGTGTNGAPLALRGEDAPGTNANGGDLFLIPGTATGTGLGGDVIVPHGDVRIETGSLSVGGAVNLGDTAADALTLAGTLQRSAPLVFDGATTDGNRTTLAVTDPTAPRTITLPDASGTVLVARSGVSAGSPTPSVQNLTVLALEGYTAPVNIVNLLGGLDGQVVVVVAGNNPAIPMITDDDSPIPGNFRLRSNLNWQALPNHTLTLARHNGVWFETSRSEN